MKRQGALPPLLLPVAVLVAVSVLAALLARQAAVLVSAAEQRLASQQRLLADARLKHSNAGSEKELIQRYLPAYQALQALGFVGAEQRLTWVDALAAANRDAGLDNLQYQIGQQGAYPLANEFGGTALPVRQSISKLTIPLVHEEDLMRFFRSLAEKRAGLFTINACLLRRTGSEDPSGAASNVGAECEIAWITVSDVEPDKTP